MFTDDTPLPVARTLATSLSGRTPSLRSVVHRARLEHLATELLRLAGALRLPVPIQDIYYTPPLTLWRLSAEQILAYPGSTDDPYTMRLLLAQAVARLVGDSRWSARLRYVDERPFTPGEVGVFALALLVPAPLLDRLNQRQRTPHHVSALFQVPQNEAAARLSELGYLSPSDESRLANERTM